MRKMKIIRILIGLNLIIFFLPFFNACTNTPLRKENKEIIESIKNSPVSKVEKKQLLKDENDRFTDRKRSNDRHVMNAYQLAKIPFQDPDKKMLKEPFFYFTLCFSIQILSVIFMLFLAIKNNLESLKWMILSNISLLFISIIIASCAKLLEYLDQVKIGLYLYLLNLILIYTLILKVKRKTKLNVL